MWEIPPLPEDEVVYLDNHATTPCDPRVARALCRCLQETHGNPSSPHEVGQTAKRVVEEARRVIANQIGALPGEIIFTAGASESNNIAIKGLAAEASKQGDRRQIITSAIEHKSVLKPATAVTNKGFCHQVIPVTKDGYLNLKALKALVGEETLLVSVQAANNEVGTIQPIPEAVEVAKECGAYFHCDAAQALGRMKIDVQEWGIDLLSLSAHKAYGPKGIGILYIKGGSAGLPLEAITHGGSQEGGLRPGTLNVPACVGFAEACRIINQEFEREVTKLADLRDRLEGEILKRLNFAEVIGGRDHRLPSTTNIRFRGLEADAVLARLEGVAVSTGSACEAGAPEPSHVLSAMGLSRDAAYECIRMAVGRFTSAEDIQVAEERLVEAASQLQSVL